MKQSVSLITLGVGDCGKARAFYEALGSARRLASGLVDLGRPFVNERRM